jgi:hypothetical protein
MSETLRDFIGYDFDGTLVGKPKSWDILRRATKFFLPIRDGAIEGINFISSQGNLETLGIFTVRPEWLRKRQTKKQIKRKNIPNLEVTHTANSYKGKIEALFNSALGWNPKTPITAIEGRIERQIELKKIGRILLVDDSADKVIKAAEELYEEKPNIQPLLERFILITFDPSQQEAVKEEKYDKFRSIIYIRGWSDIQSLISVIRT